MKLVRHKAYLKWALSLSLTLVLCVSCGSKQTRTEPIPEIANSKIPQIKKTDSKRWETFFDAEQAFTLKQYDEAIRLYRIVKNELPSGRAHMVSSYRLGTIYYQREQYRKGSYEFAYFLEKFPNSDLAFDVTYNLAASEYQQEKYRSAFQILSRLKKNEIKRQGPSRAAMVYRLKAITASALGSDADSVVAYAASLQLPNEALKKAEIQERIDSHLGRITSAAILERLLLEVTEPITRSKIDMRMNSLTNSSFRTTVSIPDGSFASREFELPSGTAGKRFNIGVVLPLTGRWAIYGKRALDAILLASQVFSAEKNFKFRLFIRDTASNESNASNAVEELVFKHEVFAIIGPTNYRESLAVAKKAFEYRVVNLSLSVKEGISSKGPYLFQNGLTPRVQIENLVSYAMDQLQFRRFAILAPDDRFGREMAMQFWDTVEARSGKVVAYETYSPKETDFQKQVKLLTGLAHPKELRPFETEKREEFLEAEKEAGVRNPKAQLPPVTNYFDAIFIPDSPKAIGQIAPALAYFDVTGKPLMGTIEWNSDQLYKRAGKYVVGAIFPGAVNMASSNPKQKQFIRNYTNTFGQAPDLLAAQAYEAMQLVGISILRSSSDNRNELVRQLMRLNDFPTPLGSLTFDGSRVARRKLPIFTLENGGRLVEHNTVQEEE